MPDDIDPALLQNNDVCLLYELCLLVQKGPNAEEKLINAFDKTPSKIGLQIQALNVIKHKHQKNDKSNWFVTPDNWLGDIRLTHKLEAFDQN